jgi:hypothetical protein
MRLPSREKMLIIWETIRAPRVTIDCFGGDYPKLIWNVFTQRHPKFPLMRRNTFGTALQKMPATDKLLGGGAYKTMRSNIAKAKKRGYSFRAIRPEDYSNDIMAVNLSSIERQGKPMDSSYTDLNAVKAYNGQPGDWFGVFDQKDKLQAYTHLPVIGDAFVFSRILGNATLLNDGIMHMLVGETLRQMAVKRDKIGHPNWAMYDMFIGGGAGLREFKKRTGFRPYRVTWRWVKM